VNELLGAIGQLPLGVGNCGLILAYKRGDANLNSGGWFGQSILL